MNILLEWLHYHQTFANKAAISFDAVSYGLIFLTLHPLNLFLIERIFCNHAARGAQNVFISVLSCNIKDFTKFYALHSSLKSLQKTELQETKRSSYNKLCHKFVL